MYQISSRVKVRQITGWRRKRVGKEITVEQKKNNKPLYTVGLFNLPIQIVMHLKIESDKKPDVHRYSLTE